MDNHNILHIKRKSEEHDFFSQFSLHDTQATQASPITLLNSTNIKIRKEFRKCGAIEHVGFVEIGITSTTNIYQLFVFIF